MTMPDPSAAAGLATPVLSLVSLLDIPALRELMQPVHYLIRLLHILSMAMFFGGILLLDLRLLGIRNDFSLKGVAAYVLPYVIGALAVTMITGVLLFLYDPVGVSNRPYFYPKMALIGLAIVNAVIFQFAGHSRAMAAVRSIPVSARGAGALSLGLWIGVVMCACFNRAGPPAMPMLATSQATMIPGRGDALMWEPPPGVTVRMKGDTR